MLLEGCKSYLTNYKIIKKWGGGGANYFVVLIFKLLIANLELYIFYCATLWKVVGLF